MAIQYIDTADLSGKSVLARFDFNVPLKDGKITDTSRIDLALPTIEYILKQEVKKLTIMSHLGRPKSSADTQFSLEPVASYLADKLDKNVVLAPSSVDGGVKELLSLNETKIVLLENLRYHKEEKENDEEFAGKLAQYAEVYINDAFGVLHRKHASVYAIHKFFKNKAYAGLLVKQEVQALDKVLHQPKKPFLAIVGGAKVADKIKTIERLLTIADKLLIGGAMAYPFLKSKGINVGKSLCGDEDVELAKKILRQDKAGKIQLPVDHVIAQSMDDSGQQQSEQSIPDDFMALDIGEQTIRNYQSAIDESATVLWNGPMGLFEKAAFSKGTFSIAERLANSKAYTVVGGGDSVSAINKSGHQDKIDHVSTGGGASLEYIEKGELPGIQALKHGI